MLSNQHTALEILEREQVKALSQPANFLAAIHLLARLMVGLGLFWLSVELGANSSFFLVPVFLACGAWHSFWGYAGIGHEFYHDRVFSSRLLNQFLFRAASYLTLNNPSFFTDSHSFHHRHTFAEGDRESFSVQDWRLHKIILYGSVDLHLLVKRLVYLGANAVGYVFKGGRLERLERQHQREALGMLSTQLAIHALLFLFSDTVLGNLLFLLLPVTGLLLSRILAQSQHLGLQHHRDHGPLQHSRTLVLPWLLEFLYAGMQYHAAHHLVPAVPYYRLPTLHALLKAKCLLKEERLMPFLLNEFPRLIHAERQFMGGSCE
jgi:fatty acid desaturase